MSLVARIAELANRLPSGSLRAIAKAIAATTSMPLPEQRDGIAASVATPTAREALLDLFEAWAKEPSLTPAALAFAIETATEASSRARQQQSIELVWSGPRPRGTDLRRIDEALLALVEAARAELLVVTFAAYDVPAVRGALEAAVSRGVALTLVLESTIDPGPLAALGRRVADRAQIYGWPESQRPGEAEKPGVLHAKCAVADRRRLLVSSANLTGSALASNMELGLLVSGGDIPADVVRHFERLVAQGVLR